MRILAIDTATGPVLSPEQRVLSMLFELCPRNTLNVSCPWCRRFCRQRRARSMNRYALAFGRGRAALRRAYRRGIAQGLALGQSADDQCSTLATMAQGAWRKTGDPRTFAAMMTRGWAKCAGGTSVMRGASGRAKTEAIAETGTGRRAVELLFRRVGDRRTGWSAWPDLAKGNLTLHDGEVSLPAAEDMLPSPVKSWRQGTVAVEHAEPVLFA